MPPVACSPLERGVRNAVRNEFARHMADTQSHSGCGSGWTSHAVRNSTDNDNSSKDDSDRVTAMGMHRKAVRSYRGSDPEQLSITYLDDDTFNTTPIYTFISSSLPTPPPVFYRIDACVAQFT